MSDRIDVEYNVKVTGLEEAKVAADSASSSAASASNALRSAKDQGTSSLSTMLMTVRAANGPYLDYFIKN